MKTRRKRLFILSLAVFAAIVFGLTGCKEQKERAYTALADFAHAKIGTFPGSEVELAIQERFPEAERVYYGSLSDLAIAVQTGKIDGFALDKAFYRGIAWERDEFSYIKEPLRSIDYTYFFPQNEIGTRLKEQMDEFILALQADGTLKQLQEKWFSDTEPEGAIDFSGLTGENGTLRLAIGTDNKPFIYIKNTEYTGFEIEIAVMFAREYGYAIDFIEVNFDGAILGVETGKYDMGAFAVNPTAERAEKMHFSIPTITSDVVIIVCGEANERGPFLLGLLDSFKKTFIREDRWKLFMEGIGVTVFISCCSMLFGTILGFCLLLLSRSVYKWVRTPAQRVAAVYVRAMEGTPIVVILMILFYVVFADWKNISGVWIAVIGFSLTFGAFVYSNLHVAVSSVNPGQIDAAYALGYTRTKTFFRIVLPQAMTIFLPSYCGEVAALIQATAVVGYIAVNDLTRMGDIVRSNTYEAFFPLISTAILYFILTWIASALLNLAKMHFEPKRRSEKTILKGIRV